jgi:hypothetical protein
MIGFKIYWGSFYGFFPCHMPENIIVWVKDSNFDIAIPLVWVYELTFHHRNISVKGQIPGAAVRKIMCSSIYVYIQTQSNILHDEYDNSFATNNVFLEHQQQ